MCIETGSYRFLGIKLISLGPIDISFFESFRHFVNPFRDWPAER